MAYLLRDDNFALKYLFFDKEKYQKYTILFQQFMRGTHKNR